MAVGWILQVLLDIGKPMKLEPISPLAVWIQKIFQGTVLTSGSGTSAGSITDADHAGSAGQAGTGGTANNIGGNGNPGRIVIIPGCSGGCGGGPTLVSRGPDSFSDNSIL